MKQQLLLLDQEIHKMNFETGRPDHIEDALVRMHTGQWFGWNGKEKIYANLIIHDDSKTNYPFIRQIKSIGWKIWNY